MWLCFLSNILALIYNSFCLFVFKTKKSKKKAKQAVKDTKTVTADGKEPEEGEIF